MNEKEKKEGRKRANEGGGTEGKGENEGSKKGKTQSHKNQ